MLEAAGVSHRCTLVGVFLDSVPSGGDAYMLRWIIHDWDEGCALRILASLGEGGVHDQTKFGFRLR